jgi:hypothetical protein
MSRLATTITAVLMTAALTASAAQAAGWQHFSSPSMVPAAAPASTKQLLKQATTAFRQYTGTDLSPVLRQLAIRLPHLTGAERRQAQSLLARPTDGAADPQDSGYTSPEAAASPSCSAHFCVHWVDAAGDPDAPDPADGNGDGVPDYVDTTLSTAEQSYSVENGQLGWRAPKSDGKLGGSVGKVDIYLKQLGGTGIYGYSAPDPGQQNEGDNALFAYLVIDNDFQASEFPGYASPLTPLQVTLAHEYNHVLQFGYDFNQDTWFLESTAVWMEGKVFPAALDYLQYLRGWVQLTTQPLTTFNGTDPNDRHNLKVYGTAVWNKWLDEQFGPNVIRGAWESSLSTTPASFAVAAYDRSIRQHGGKGFADQFDRFAAATAEWQASNSGFPEGSLYPDVTRAGNVSVNGIAGSPKLNHTTYALFNIRPTTAPRIRLGMRAPMGTAAAVAIVGRTGASPGGSESVVLKELPKGGAGSVTIANPSQYARLTAVLINSDAKLTGKATPGTGDFIYSNDNQPYYARLSTDFKAPHIVRASPSPGRKGVSTRASVKITFSEGMVGVSAKSIQLIASNGRAVAAQVHFKPGSKTARLEPNGFLSRGRHYRVRIDSTVTDTSVNALSGPKSWSFTVTR